VKTRTILVVSRSDLWLVLTFDDFSRSRIFDICIVSSGIRHEVFSLHCSDWPDKSSFGNLSKYCSPPYFSKIEVLLVVLSTSFFCKYSLCSSSPAVGLAATCNVFPRWVDCHANAWSFCMLVASPENRVKLSPANFCYTVS
jgi:hypothetical protein